jgi:glycosyltransferase involved in cell wall biosynthesis
MSKPPQLNSLSIFFPTYNEEKNIAETIETADQVARQYTTDYEIIVVNDGSTDQTAQVVNSLGATYPNLRLINHETNQGYGAALMTGFNAATKEWVFFTDADLQFDLGEISKLVEYVSQYDVIIGYRAKRNDPFIRFLNAKGWNILNRVIFNLQVHDIDCAFKLIKGLALKPILPEIISHGAMISAEMLIRLKNSGHAIKEVPVSHFPRKAGSPTGAKPQVILKAFRELIQVKRNLANSTRP